MSDDEWTGMEKKKKKCWWKWSNEGEKIGRERGKDSRHEAKEKECEWKGGNLACICRTPNRGVISDSFFPLLGLFYYYWLALYSLDIRVCT